MKAFSDFKKNIVGKLGSVSSSYLKDFSSFSVYYIASAVIVWLSTTIINANLSQEEYGKYSYYRSIFEFLGGVLSLAIYNCYLRFNTKGVSPKLRKLVLRIVALASFVLACICYYYTKSLLALFFVFVIVYNERLNFTRSVMDVKGVNHLRLFSALITAVILGSFYLLKINFRYEYVLFALGFGYMYSLRFFVSRNDIIIDNASFSYKDVFKYVLPLLLMTIVNWALNLSGQVVIKENFGFEEVATFGIAQRILAFLKLFSGMLLMFYPMVYYREIENKNFETIRLFRIGMSLLMIVVSALAFIFSDLIYTIFGATKYIDYTHYFRILVIAELIFTITTFYNTYIGYVLKTYITLIICSIGSIVNLIILCFLNKFGIALAAYAILVANIIMSILYFLTAYRMERKYVRETIKNESR